MNFDRIARPYRWLEYATLGRALERTRTRLLPELLHSRSALVFGDGDGRFLAELLGRNRSITAEAIDISPGMLQLLEQRCRFAGDRLETRQADARNFRPVSHADLVVTHFFLDCLTQADLEAFIRNLAPTLSPDALWVVSDFRIPHGRMRLPAKVLVRGLYLAFRILTGLKTNRLPDHESSLRQAGLTRIAHQTSLSGLLFTELWQLQSS